MDTVPCICRCELCARTFAGDSESNKYMRRYTAEMQTGQRTTSEVLVNLQVLQCELNWTNDWRFFAAAVKGDLENR